MAEIAFEYLAAALETTRGTAIAAPTHYLNMSGMLKPTQSYFRPAESRGLLAEYTRSALVREGSEFEADGGLDTDLLPFILSMIVRGGVTPTTPGGGTTTRLWTFAPSMTSDLLKSATFWSGDPGTQIYKAPFVMADELTIAADASSEDGATMSLSGWGNAFATTSAPTLPGQTLGPLMSGLNMQLWIDTASAIGTTEITGRLVKAEATIPSGAEARYTAAGPTASKSFTKVGAGRRHAELTIELELADNVQMALALAGTKGKTRLRINGPLIEGVLYNFVEIDIYGPLNFDDFGENGDTGRTLGLKVLSEYDSTAGYDFAVKVQNAKTTI